MYLSIDLLFFFQKKKIMFRTLIHSSAGNPSWMNKDPPTL